MQIRQNISLSKFSTMRLGGTASFLTEVATKEDLVEAVAFAKAQKIDVIMIGSGSNIVWSDDGFNGLVIVNRILGYEAKTDDANNYELSVGSGEDWDSVVERSVKAGATGIEALSLIPGTSGATPVQNVGAYGQEISQTLVSIEAYDNQTEKFVVLQNEECGFGYRTSRFKTADHGRFFIISIFIKLKIGAPKAPFYPSVEQYLSEHEIDDVTPHALRNAVIYIRQQKMPDPALVANNGSFFANPIISKTDFEALKGRYPHVVFWRVPDEKFKISAAWLVETAGFKNFHDDDTGMATWPKQCLVLVNEHANSTKDLIKFRDKIVQAVEQISGIKVSQEPELLPR